MPSADPDNSPRPTLIHSELPPPIRNPKSEIRNPVESAIRNPPTLIALALISFVSLGLPDSVLGVAWPSVQTTFDLPISRLGVVLTASVTGYLLSSFFSGQIVRWIGVGWLLAGSSALVTLGLGGIAITPFWAGMVIGGLLAGLGSGAVDAGINSFAAERFSPRLVTWLHACYGTGAMIGPLLMTATITAGPGWRGGYAVLAAILAGMSILFVLTRRLWSSPYPQETTQGPPAAPVRAAASADAAAPTGPIATGATAASDHDTPHDAARAAGIIETLRRPVVWGNVLLFFLYTGIEVTAAQWLFSLLTLSRGVSESLAGTVVGLYWAALTGGRLLFGQLATRFTPLAILRFSITLAPIAAALIWLPRPAGIDLIGACLLGFALAPIFPLMISATPHRVGRRFAAQSIGLQVAAANLGVAALPGLAGVLARERTLEIIPPYLLAATVVLAVLHEAAAR